MKTKKPLACTRRQLLSYLGLGALCNYSWDPAQMLARCLVDGLIADAQAQSASPAKNFISIMIPGAPTRWIWDGFLSLHNESIVPNASVKNALITDSYLAFDTTSQTYPANITYRADPVTIAPGKVVYLPPLWSRNMPVTSGSPVPMSSLLNNTLIMRGVDMQVDLGHARGPGKVLFPLGASASLTGLVADASSAPLPMVGMKGYRNYGDPINQGYKSLKGTTPTLIENDKDTLSATLSPFINDDPSTLSSAPKLNSPAIQLAIKSALDELGQYASSAAPGSDVLYKNSSNASKLFQTAFGDLKNTVYPTLYNKYFNLVKKCAQTATPNLIPSSGSGMYSLTSNAFSTELVYQFAVAEYLLTSGLSSCISIASNSTRVAGLTAANDEHVALDRQQSIICQSFQFLALSAMVYELRKVLIQKGIWDQTLIHISSEYNRSPREDMSGSDHAPNANVVTMMSGAIKVPMFIGNIKYDATPNTAAHGTYGVAAPVQTDFGVQVITNNVAASTTAAILGVQNPMIQSRSVVSVDSSGAVTARLTEEPKNV